MLSVRVFSTDFASDTVARLTWELGATDHLAVFGRLCAFYAQVAKRHPDGVLDGLYPAGIAALAHWSGAADVFLEAMLRAGVLCRPSVDPHHHGRCPARGPNRDGEPRRQHPPAELCVHDWDRRAGPAFRAFVSDSRPDRQRFLLRPPPRRARVGYGPAPRGAGSSQAQTPPTAPQGAKPESPAPRGASGFDLQGADFPSLAAGSEAVSPGAPRRAEGSDAGTAPQGAEPTQARGGGPAPQGVKRRPKPHPRPREEETTSPASDRRRGGPAVRRGPAAAPRGRAIAERQRDDFDEGLAAFSRAHEDVRAEVGLATMQWAFIDKKCPGGKHPNGPCPLEGKAKT